MLIRWLPARPNLSIVSRHKLFMAFSALLIAFAIAMFFVRGLNFGVDFRGGILLEVKTDGPADLSDLRTRLGGLGLGGVTLQEFGASDDVLINVQRQEGDEAAQIDAINIIKEELGDTVVEYRRTEFVGPKVGDELREAGLLATVLSLLGIAVYIWFRFEWQFSLAALTALVHDVLATVGFYSVTQIEFNLATLAAVLMIAGYSINDTVVVFDRVRETMRKFKKMSLPELFNRAVNDTLSRTVLTSLTTLLALFSLFIFGGEVIRGFTIGLIWGVVIGTYSSIAIAVPLLLYLGVRHSSMVPEEEDGDGGKTAGSKSPAPKAS